MTERVKKEISQNSKEAYEFLLVLIARGIVKVVPDSEVAKVEFRLCSEHRITPNNLEGKCSQCDKTVYIDPGYPDGPKLICIACATSMGKGEQSFTE